MFEADGVGVVIVVFLFVRDIPHNFIPFDRRILKKRAASFCEYISEFIGISKSVCQNIIMLIMHLNAVAAMSVVVVGNAVALPLPLLLPPVDTSKR